MSDGGGIGVSIPRADGVVATPEGPDARLAEATAQMEYNSRVLREGIETAVERIGEQAEAIAQLRGQVARQESVLPQFQAAFQQLDARMTALAQQVMRNNRYAALDLATKSRQPGEQRASVVQNAKDYLAFIDPPAPQPVAAVDGDALNGEAATH